MTAVGLSAGLVTETVALSTCMRLYDSEHAELVASPVSCPHISSAMYDSRCVVCEKLMYCTSS